MNVKILLIGLFLMVLSMNVSALLLSPGHHPLCDAFGNYRCNCDLSASINTHAEIEKECAAWGHYHCMCGHGEMEGPYNP